VGEQETIVPVPITFVDEERVGFEIFVSSTKREELIAEFVAYETYQEDRKHIATGEHFVGLTKIGNWERRLFAIPWDGVSYIL
jgi:hypothetical protein